MGTDKVAAIGNETTVDADDGINVRFFTFVLCRPWVNPLSVRLFAEKLNFIINHQNPKTKTKKMVKVFTCFTYTSTSSSCSSSELTAKYG